MRPRHYLLDVGTNPLDIADRPSVWQPRVGSLSLTESDVGKMPPPTKNEMFNRSIRKILEGVKTLNNDLKFPTCVTIKTESGTQVYGPDILIKKCRAAYSCSCPHVCDCDSSDTQSWTDAFLQSSLQLIKKQTVILEEYQHPGNEIYRSKDLWV